MANKQDSNLTGLSICEESTPGVLPAASAQHWMRMDPNSYPDFGNDISKVSRKTINPARKVKKGGVTDVDASGGFDHDMMLNGLKRVMRGFFFTDGDEAGTSDPLTLANKRGITVTAADDTFTLDGTMTGALVADTIIFADGFSNDANNGTHLVTSATTTTAVVASALVDETAPAAARIRAVGHQANSGAISATVSGDFLLLANSDSNFDDMNITAGSM